MKRLLALSLAVVLALLLPMAPVSAGGPETKLTADDGAAGDYFGYSVSISGDTAVVGAYQDDGSKGSAYVFVRSGAAWSQQAKLAASDGTAGDSFGISVSISGDTVVVGAPADDGKGSAYVFLRTGTTWSQQAKLIASDGAAVDFFGGSVSISGNTVVVGAMGEDPSNITNAGSAYVFVRSGTTWSQEQKLTAGDAAFLDMFGNSVSISGDTAVVGASFDFNNSKKGSAYVFVRTGTTWSQQAKLTASDGAAEDLFGYSISISGDTAVVGAHQDDGSKGSAYVFERSGTTWGQQAKLIAGDGAADDYFGISVSISGDTAVVGAYRDDDKASSTGSAYVFERTGTTWSQQDKLTASDGAAGDYFGYSVSINGDTIAVGAHYDDDDGDNSGSAYVYGEKLEYTLAINIEGEGDVGQDPSAPYYQGDDTEVTLTANPDTDWAFDHWEGALTGSANPETITMDDNKDVTATFTLAITPMTEFNVTHAKLDFKKKADDDKVRVQGQLAIDLVNGDGVDISEDVTVTVGALSETITMVDKGKKGDKWEYKRSKGKGGEGNIQHITIDWKKGKFDIRMDKSDLSGMTNPVNISIQIGNDFGEETIQMKEKKHHWDFKN